MRKIFFAALFVLYAVPAFATDKPKAIDPAIQAAAPVGQGEMTHLFSKVYDVSLWSDAPAWSLDVPFALAIEYNKEFSSEDLMMTTIQDMQRTPGLDAEHVIYYGRQLRAMFPAVKKGDVLTALYIPKQGTTFFINNQRTGVIPEKIFAEKYFGIWLAPDAPEADLRKALLGGHS